jgi:hypothetical protein
VTDATKIVHGHRDYPMCGPHAAVHPGVVLGTVVTSSAPPGQDCLPCRIDRYLEENHDQ